MSTPELKHPLKLLSVTIFGIKKPNLASLEVWLQLFISCYHHQHAGIILLDAHVALHFINIKRMMVKDINVSFRTKLYKVSLSKRK